MVCLLETFLNASIDSLDDRITIEEYNILRVGYPKKRVGVYIYYKKHLPIIKKDDLCNSKKCLVTEVRTGEKKCFLSSLHGSLS